VLHRRSTAFRWLLTACWAGVIFYVSSRPGSTLPGGYSVQGHLFEYFILGALLVWALAEERPSRSTIALAIVLASLYGVSDEIHQQFVVLRTPDVLDWVVDTVGATAGALAAAALIVRTSARRTPRAPGREA
jgi:hypothetical protein